ncbi:succinylglutamate desuccinylase/aspartoacylase family protein [Roseateles sp. BYS180W]|uniref:Succinylglutamate desuccinylase/aspartoacylase family protein n=1 Tax=Roseateles rivi TaxID=3299028 RepID=A0ABW7FY41_9BURK
MREQRHPLISPVPGTQRELLSLHYGQPGRGPKVYIQTSLHADELPGMLTAWHLRQHFNTLEAQGAIRGEVVLVPMANPIGASQWWQQAHLGRFESLSGENFNRHYPAFALAAAQAAQAQLSSSDAAHNVSVLRQALKAQVAAYRPHTELQSLRRTLYLLACDADIVLDLHCDAQSLMHLYTTPACWPQCEALAADLQAPLTLLAEESGDHPFDEACSGPWQQWQQHFNGEHVRFPIPQACMSTTVELRGQHDVNHELARQDAQALLHYLARRGVLDLTPPPLPSAGQARPLAGCEFVETPVGGVLAYVCELGREVQAGECLAHVIDPLSGVLTEIVAPVDGLFFARDALHLVCAGARIAKVAGRNPTRSGKLLGAR